MPARKSYESACCLICQLPLETGKSARGEGAPWNEGWFWLPVPNERYPALGPGCYGAPLAVDRRAILQLPAVRANLWQLWVFRN